MSDETDFAEQIPEEVRDTFLGNLLHDVVLALDWNEQANNQATRRNLIRTMFAAIEGCSHIYRDHVRSLAENIDAIDSPTAMALSESTVVVSETGKATQKAKYLSLSSRIGLVARLAARTSTQIDIDFAGRDWQNFQKAIGVRNRITHPQSKSDLHLTENDIKIVEGAFFWLLRAMERGMAALNAEALQYLSVMTEFGDKLLAGDSNAVALYEAAKRALDE